MDDNHIESMIRGKWFGGHEAHFSRFVDDTNGEFIESLVWRRPGTNTYAIRYLCMRNRLIVTGDVGDAAYLWSEPVNLKWISELDLHYFASKCRSSEVGHQYVQWDERTAQLSVAHHVGQLTRDKIALWKEFGGRNELSSEWEWHAWLNDHGYEVFCDLDGLYAVGEVVHVRCRGHLIGLKMAFGR